MDRTGVFGIVFSIVIVLNQFQKQLAAATFGEPPDFSWEKRGNILPNSREAAFLGAAPPIMGRQAAALSRMRSHILSGFGHSPFRLAKGGGIGEDTVPYKRRIVFDDHGKQTHCLVR